MKYFHQGKFNPEKLPKLNTDRQALSLVPERTKILEIGCADGFMGEYLIKKKGCRVIGVEINKEAAKKAQDRGLTVVCGDIEEEAVLSKLRKEEKFQVILCTSSIEHLHDPMKALKNWRNFLDINGFMIITTPNIGHWSARLKTFSGKFPREDYGIFDEEHLHFFTINSFKGLIEKCGFCVEHLGIDPIGGGLPKVSKFLSLFFPDLFAYQIVIKAKVLPSLQKSQ